MANTNLTEHPLYTITLTASASITECRFVTAAGAYAGTLGDPVIGVSRSTTSVASGSTFPVIVSGKAVVQAGEAITAGAVIYSSTAGKAMMTADWIADAVTGVRGLALTAAGAADEFIEVYLF